MHHPKSSASAPASATNRRRAADATKLPTKTVPASKHARPAGKFPVGESKATEGPAAKGAVLATGKPKPAVVARTRDKALSYITVYRASPLERIDMIRRGIPASEAKRLFAELPIGQGAGFKALNLSTATVNKKAKQGAMLSPEESERIVGFAKLVGQLEAMIQDSGDPAAFDARAWMARWLAEPLPAFGGARPADLMDTMEGQGLVSAALAKIQSGAYA
jgi:putative toxin-antitoxin system antitoxin component (TIGR02293 family)